MAMRSYFEHHHPLARNHSPEKRPTSSVTERRGASEGSARICMHAYDMTWALSAQNERGAERERERERESESLFPFMRVHVPCSLHFVICV